MFWILLAWNLMANEVVIQGEEVSDLQYQQWVLQHPEKQSYISSLEMRNKSIILDELKRAQFHFLKGSLEQAQKHFKNIAEKRFKQDWKKEERKSIHYSLFRLAQLEKNNSLSAHYLLKALQYDSDIKPNTKLFPPPLITKYQQLKRDHKVQVFALPNESKKFSKILVNGKKLSGSPSFFRARNGEVRISFLSNKYKEVHLMTNAQNIENSKLPIISLATGPCENPHFQFSQNTNYQYSLYNENCQSPAMVHSTDLQPLAMNPPSSPSPRPKAFYKSTWFWAGVAVVVTGLAYHQLEQQNKGTSSPQPATKQPREISN